MQLCENASPIQKIQEEAFEILSFLDKVCREQGFTYYLAYGTLLGAIRHQGFIPWDDDVDVWMPREDYMKMLDYLQNKNTDERFGSNDGEYRHPGERPSQLQMRVIDKKRRIRRDYAGVRAEMNPWIDIFCLDVFPEKKKKSYLNAFKRNLFRYKIARCKKFLVVQDSFFGKMNKIIYTLHNKYHWFKHTLNVEKRAEKTVASIMKYHNQNGADYKEYFCFASVYLPRPEKCFFAQEWFGEPIELEFEGKKFFAPSNSDAVLKTLYNDYMQLPPVEQRVYTHGTELIEE
ncbi:MAG: LicD family protein [Clostridia bacterium]|nr:LicD family protein [Clostridia bacterium]